MTRADALRIVARPALLAAWSLLAWGHLILAAALFNAVREGPGAACGRLLPAHGASVWTWLNALAAALAVAFWVVAAAWWLWTRPMRRQ